jgi:DNA-binding MarR family transcriptional regulator
MAARPEPDRLEAGKRLLEVARVVTDRLDADLRVQCGLPLAWYSALEALRAAGGSLRIQELAATLGVHKSTASRVLDRLVEHDLALREPDPADGRGAHAVITRAGRERVRRASAVHARSVQRHLGRHLTDGEAERLLAVLGKVPTFGDHGRSTSTTRASA